MIQRFCHKTEIIRVFFHCTHSSGICHTGFLTYTIAVCTVKNSRRWTEELSETIRMFHPDPACKLSANPFDILHCCVYSEKLLMMDRGTVQNM